MRPVSTKLTFSVLLGAVSSIVYADSITVYSALEQDEINSYLQQLSVDHPDLEVNVLRLSTGDLAARLIAEAGRPQVDVIWGLALSNMIDPQILSQLAPYSPEGVDVLAAPYKDEEGRWFAATGYLGALCINEPMLERLGLPTPASWEDLADPVYKGEIVMPNPASSGTGYMQMVAIEQGMPDGWALIEQINGNVAQYTSSGSRPCQMARMGEYAIGASFAFVAMRSIAEGYPIKMVIPEDFAGYELEASAMLSTSSNPEAAQKFLDWTLSDSVADLYGDYKEIVTIPGATRPEGADEAGLPENVEDILFPMDFAQSASDRPSFLTEWQQRIGR
ncbi:extracellular solute-binding protein [Vreelandella nigrificans]|uniref:Iron ABC transporter substrate-binding protein n=1 Tax=Vreelandella nigrificans TaxID=2042704 RepID=A0A2A4HHF9_9GAMM|nr:extracellular solute-binding protein [Halomonas nigrificans]PCF94220.1 iron ABC transporter substrate-binding protein [Halomonas nigrificans]